MIAVGGCVFIGCTDRGFAWVGAILFAVGLFTIFHFGLDLYTGKVGYALENKPSYIFDLLVIILGNFIGCLLVGYMMPLDTAVTFINGRMTDVDYLRVLFKEHGNFMEISNPRRGQLEFLFFIFLNLLFILLIKEILVIHIITPYIVLVLLLLLSGRLRVSCISL